MHAPGNDKRISGGTVGGADGNPCQVEQVESISVEGLVGKREPDEVERRQRVFGLKRIEGDIAGAHELFHVHPGGVGALGQGVGTLVDQVVEDLQAKVGDADIVDIGKDKGDPGGNGRPIFDYHVQFATHVPARFLYL